MSNPLVVINVVGLSPNMLGDNTPNINTLLAKGYQPNAMKEAFPAVTTTAQSAMLTGKYADEHGIVGNGWYFSDLAEVGFWKQANQLVQSDKIWDKLKAQNANFKVSKLFWWYNMYANVDASITPRPHYLADGGKIFDLYSSPEGLHQEIEQQIGTFPFFTFWGPNAGIESSQWIAQAAVKEFEKNSPDLQLIYLPHLDYNLQRLGPNDPQIANDIKAVDNAVGLILDGLASFNVDYLIVSEYGITEVNQAVNINQILRQAGYIKVRKTGPYENLDCGASDAFAVADHQVAHVYINDKSKQDALKQLLINTTGIEQVLDKNEQQALNICHERSGDLVAICQADAWFTYYFWLDDNVAPDYARTVDIHRKPGYDPLEMFIDPNIVMPKLKVISNVIKKKLGFRMLMDVIPLEPSLIKGSHGRPVDDPQHGPVLILPPRLQNAEKNTSYQMTDVFDLIFQHFQS
ncbi:alkaline phosphatase family protein [Saccharobesus litoralis]|uniref:Alkaline phosphatase family protein n=1 Tax=Saccharobesus litoralis TaxID=2172099 RepID=A0A2S0VTJ6_9ALTE|nr:nucleotide pyrophosphatase/phosphodiesterase family protein [Saccharobesus litoralis]AWB67420.1 alkaline phosphatase family protein [Saccharobesus litoralis]